MFPVHRPRRLRKNETIRRMVRETSLSPDDFIYPLFVTFGKGVRKEIVSMPGCRQESVDEIVKHAKEVYSLGIPSVLLFGIPEHKDEVGSSAYDEHGVVQEAIKAIKDAAPELYVITDVCMCEYTSHGHCGIIEGCEVQNDPTLELLAKEAVSHARAGADMVAPSDMMDGRVEAIRLALDEEGLGRGCETLGDGLWRLTLGEAVGRLADGAAVEGRAPTLPVEGPAPPEPQPRASVPRAEFAAAGEPLLFRRLWSGCHFFCALVDDGRAPEAAVDRSRLTLESRLTFLSMSISTSP